MTNDELGINLLDLNALFSSYEGASAFIPVGMLVMGMKVKECVWSISHVSFNTQADIAHEVSTPISMKGGPKFGHVF